MSSAEPGVELWMATAPDADCAERIARKLVEERLAACVNLVPGLRSIYRWQGAVEDATEVLLLMKTRADRAADLERRLCELHPYDVPELLRLPAGGSEPYLRWVREEAAPVSLADALERAAEALPEEAEAIRPANGDPHRLLDVLSGEAAGRLLDWLLRHEAGEAEELLEVWLEEEAGLAAVRALDEAGLPKAGRKLLRRARHKLRSAGVELAEPEPGQRVATLPSVDDELEAALVTSLDGSGARLVYLVESDPSGGARLFEAAIDDRRGVLDASVYSASRSKVRAFLKEIDRRPGMNATAVEAGSLRALLARAVARHPAKRRLPREFSEWRSRLLAGAEGQKTPGELAATALGATPPDAARLRAVVERIAKGELGPWPEPGEVLPRLAETIRERAASPVLVSAAQRREQAEAALGEALPDLYAEVAGAVAAERFRECAYLLWKQDDPEAAQDCLAAAAAFDTLAVAENPVARALVEAALAPVFEALEQDPPEPEPGAAGAGVLAGQEKGR